MENDELLKKIMEWIPHENRKRETKKEVDGMFKKIYNRMTIK